MAVEVDTFLPAQRVINVLRRLKTKKGLPKQIRADNESELILVNLLSYCEYNPFSLCHIQLEKPQQNGFIERFNGSFSP
ncbi:DDE-type integrase/transposase/recombinase [Providencia stuartii]|nr:DDE-type integrase/transposase/recombinase [Providencia stuartii]NPD97090.1 DDE-type integrase/transposase/recombinase [Providencia stuartii]